MKKILFFAAVATIFAACTKDATKDLAPAKSIDTFYAVIGEEDSRVQLNDECQTVWTEGDLVSIFNKTIGNHCYKFTGKTGDRTGELSYMNGGTTGYGIGQIVALYPYNATNEIALSGKIKTSISSVQTYCKGSFGIGSNIMVAWSDNDKLSFRNVMGWIRVALTGEKTIKSIALQGNNNEPVAGNITIKSDLSFTMASDATNILTLDCGDGVALSQDTPTYFYISVPPQTFEKGISVVITDSNGNKSELKKSGAITVARNHIVPMASFDCAIEEGVSAKQIAYTTSGNEPITPQSYTGNIVSHIFESGRGVITFDCEQTEIGDSAFSGCSGLTGITIPDTVTTIGKEAFKGCSGLTGITIPDGVTTIGEEAFRDCAGLKGVHITDIAAWCNIKFGNDYGNPVLYAHNIYLNGELVKDLVIPDGVATIGKDVFYGCTGLTTITIPDSVTTIGKSAFSGCTGLTSVTIGNGVTTISENAFRDCAGLKGVHITDIAAWCNIKFGEFDSNPVFYAYNLYLNGELVKDLVIPDGITEINNFAFENCRELTSVNIPDSVTTIGGDAFYYCTGLTSITIPDSVTSIDNYAFLGCESVETITTGNGVTSIDWARGCRSGNLKTVNIGNSVTITEYYNLFYDSNNLTAFYGKYASADNRCLIVDGNLISFAPAGLTEYTIPDNVTKIGDSAFYFCSSLTSITIPNSVTEIGSAFGGCTGLTSITIPDSVTAIDAAAFYGCTGLTSITIPDSVTTIGYWAFRECSGLTSITIPGCVKAIGNATFRDCTGLTSITIPDSVTEIGEMAFYGCTGLTYADIRDGVTEIGEDAFRDCKSLARVDIGNNVTTIGRSAFRDCKSLTRVYIGNSVTTIGDSAFEGCTGMEIVIIDTGVTTIGWSAFNGCTSLTSIYCKPTTPPFLEDGAFDNISSDAIIYVPRASAETYKSWYGWDYYEAKIYGYDF